MKVNTNLQKLIKVKSDVKISKLLIQLLWKKTVSKIGKIDIFKTKRFMVRKTKENTSADIIGTRLTLKSVLLTYSNTNAGVLDCNKNNDNYVIALLN